MVDRNEDSMISVIATGVLFGVGFTAGWALADLILMFREDPLDVWEDW